jgi:hypothetical protein
MWRDELRQHDEVVRGDRRVRHVGHEAFAQVLSGWNRSALARGIGCRNITRDAIVADHTAQRFHPEPRQVSSPADAQNDPQPGPSLQRQRKAERTEHAVQDRSSIHARGGLEAGAHATGEAVAQHDRGRRARRQHQRQRHCHERPDRNHREHHTCAAEASG